MQTLKRRDFLKLAALAGTAVIAAACVPKPAEPTAAPKDDGETKTEATKAPTAKPEPTKAEATTAPKASEFQGEILFGVQGFMPTSEVENPDPKAPKREAMAVLRKEWQDIHPGVTIKFMQAPSGDYFSWLTTQLIGGTGPDIYWLWLSSLNQYSEEGKAVPLDDYLELPNKYTPEDSSPWKEHFKAPFLTFAKLNHWGGVPLDLVATGVYANIDMLKEVGIDLKIEIDPQLASPKSWAVMIDWCKKLKDAGYIAMSAGAGIINQWWITGVLSDQFLNGWLEKYDVLNYNKQVLEILQVGNLSQEEVVHAYHCMGLDVFKAPEVRAMFQLIKDWAQYMPAGFANPDFGAPMELFLTGGLGMVWDGSWSVGTILQDNRRQFEFTSFWLPPVTKESSEYAPDPVILPMGVGGYGSTTYGLNPTTIAKGAVDICVDWLMWITTPEHDEMIVNEVPSTIPSHKKAKSLPEVENLFVGETRLKAGGYHPISGPYGWFGWQEDKWGDLLRREETLYFMDEIDEETFFTNLKTEGEVLAKEVIRKAAIQYSDEGTWDLTQWQCEIKL
ncbi:MAG: extracellular solute-binding protein [Chloroflexi bacterium]|nr:extracellular solute-binding protein [Chloroflexota bacterium]